MDGHGTGVWKNVGHADQVTERSVSASGHGA